VAREVAPFGGGGIGAYVEAAARALSSVARVKVLTSARQEGEYRRRLIARDPLVAPSDVEFVFVPEPDPDDAGTFHAPAYVWSASVFEALCRAYPGGGPDIVEFPDFLAEGFVTVQARHTLHPVLRGTRVCVRAHTSAEMCAVLDGYMPDQFAAELVCEMERQALREADAVLYAGGDVLRAYESFYGADGLGPARMVRHPLHFDAELPEPGAERKEGDPVRLLYVGRLERRKGVPNLLRAVTSLQRDDWKLTLVGGDTPTGPLGTSQRAQLELMAADDERISFVDEVSREELPPIVRDHDVVVMPSLWECWPYVALEAMAVNRPVLATPVGGLVEMVQPGRSGWLTRDCSADALAEAIELVLDAPEEARAMIRARGPRAAVAPLVDERRVVRGYQELAASEAGKAPRRRTPAQGPLVSAVVPYYRLDEYVEETVASICSQTYRRLEVIVVNDGSIRAQDAVLADLAARYPIRVLTQFNAGLGAARNRGIHHSRGRYVFPLDADNTADPSFVERCLDVLEADREVAFVTSWTREVDESGAPPDGPARGEQPIGNRSRLVERNNVAGDAAAVIRRRMFELGHSYSVDLTSFEDWAFYRELHRSGHYGRVIPERLLRYRVRADSMVREIGGPQTGRLYGEMNALLRERETPWQFTSA